MKPKNNTAMFWTGDGGSQTTEVTLQQWHGQYIAVYRGVLYSSERGNAFSTADVDLSYLIILILF